ncbi:hypothetical protein ACTXT7_003272 [Hymenolepis weldensis]
MKAKRQATNTPQTSCWKGTKFGKGTGVCFDERMEQHRHEWCSDEQECPNRVARPLKLIENHGLLSRCTRIPARHVTDKELLNVHSKDYIDLVKSSANMSKDELYNLSGNYDGVFFNSHTWEASSLAAGSVTEMAFQVASGKLVNGLALVRPPGHHAMYDEACGYCIFGNVSIAVASLLDSPPLSVYNPTPPNIKSVISKAPKNLPQSPRFKRILIIDWDVHQGQGTQYTFYNDNRVLFISIHRYECQKFWPMLREGDYDFIGDGIGRGFNINIPLNKTGMTDGDYLAIFYFLIMPIAYEFNPDIVFVSSGFDAAIGDPEGKMWISPACYGHMTHQLRALADGKLVVVLEGGYFIDSLEEGCVQVLKALLGDYIAPLQNLNPPSKSVQCTISSSILAIREFWHCLDIVKLSRSIIRPDISRFPPNSWPLVKEVVWPDKNPVLPESVIAESRKMLRDFTTTSSKKSNQFDIILVIPSSSQDSLSEQPFEKWSKDLNLNNQIQIYEAAQTASTDEVIITPKKKSRLSEDDSSERSYLCNLSKSLENAMEKLVKDGFRTALIIAEHISPREIISTFNEITVKSNGCGEKLSNPSPPAKSPSGSKHPKGRSSLTTMTSLEFQQMECLSKILYVDLAEGKKLSPSFFGDLESPKKTSNSIIKSTSILAFSFGPTGSEVKLRNPSSQMTLIEIPLQCCKLACEHVTANVLTVMTAMILPMAYGFTPDLLIINVGETITKGVSLASHCIVPSAEDDKPNFLTVTQDLTDVVGHPVHWMCTNGRRTYDFSGEHVNRYSYLCNCLFFMKNAEGCLLPLFLNKSLEPSNVCVLKESRQLEKAGLEISSHVFRYLFLLLRILCFSLFVRAAMCQGVIHSAVRTKIMQTVGMPWEHTNNSKVSSTYINSGLGCDKVRSVFRQRANRQSELVTWPGINTTDTTLSTQHLLREEQRAYLPKESLAHVVFMLKNVATRLVVLTPFDSNPDNLLGCFLDGSPPGPFRANQSTVAGSEYVTRQMLIGIHPAM